MLLLSFLRYRSFGTSRHILSVGFGATERYPLAALELESNTNRDANVTNECATPGDGYRWCGFRAASIAQFNFALIH